MGFAPARPRLQGAEPGATTATKTAELLIVALRASSRTKHYSRLVSSFFAERHNGAHSNPYEGCSVGDPKVTNLFRDEVTIIFFVSLGQAILLVFSCFFA